MGNAPFITLDRVCVRLRDKLVLRDITWQIREAEHWAILGPNGAGKSTLVKALFGGVPVVGGKCVHHFCRDRGKLFGAVGFVSAELLRDHLRRERLRDLQRDFSGRTADVTRIEEIILGNGAAGPGEAPDTAGRLRRIARSLNMENLLKRDVQSASIGELNKALIARALLKRPRMLVLDESFDDLEPDGGQDLDGLTAEIVRRRVQLVLVSHRLEALPAAITHVLCMKDCRVWACGEKDKLLDPAAVERLYGAGQTGGNLWPAAGPKPAVGGCPGPERQLAKDPGETAPLVHMKNVTVRYADAVPLERINWTVRPAENWLLVGPAGSGKTTLLKLALGENLQAYANDVYLFGNKVGAGTSIREIRKRIGMVFADLQVRYWTNIPAVEVVCSGFHDAIGLYRGCTPEQMAAAAGWFQRLGIADLADQPFGFLSHGQRQLVLIARAMVKRPVLLMLDDPLKGLDIPNREKVRATIESIGRDTETSLIYGTRYADDRLPCITHVLRMEQGSAPTVEGP